MRSRAAYPCALNPPRLGQRGRPRIQQDFRCCPAMSDKIKNSNKRRERDSDIAEGLLQRHTRHLRTPETRIVRVAALGGFAARVAAFVHRAWAAGGVRRRRI
jgi:hypothetical protein